MRGRGPVARRSDAIRGLAAAALAVGAALAALAADAAPAAAADCAPRSIEDAQRTPAILFVGDVVRLENDNRWAVVLVQERWQGAEGIPDTVNVRGGPAPGVATVNDRLFATGRYLFDVRNLGPYLEDDACSATTPWSDALARYRPPDVPGASAEDPPLGFLDSGTVVLAAGLVLALLIAVVAYILILRRRQRPPDWMR